MPNPDDRSDNVDKLQRHIQNTQANMREARDQLRAHGQEMNEQDREDIVDKNERRRDAIDGFREEIRDEVRDKRS